MNCSECGERLTEAARFCSACGRRVAPDAPPISILQPPPMPRARASAAPAAERGPSAARAARPEHPGTPRAPAVAAGRTPTGGAIARPTGFTAIMQRVGPGGMVALGILVAIAACWSAARDDAVAKTAAQRRIAVAPEAAPNASQPDAWFSTRQALEGLYGSYDSNLDGVFWTVSGAPAEWGEWNGKPVFIKPLVSRTDATGTRHVLVTNSVEVRDGLVVKQGAACERCKSLLGAALFERRGDTWVLVTEHRFMKIGGAFGAPPKVSVDFPAQAGVEIRMETASDEPARTRSNVHAVILHGGKPAPAAASAPTTSAPPQVTKVAAPAAASEPALTAPVKERKTEAVPVVPAASGKADTLVAAALNGDDHAVARISSELRARPPGRGDRTTARNLNARALALSQSGSYAEAAALFREAHAADPGDAEIRENLGYALLKAERLAEAERALLAALEVAPTRPTAWGSLGYVYAKRGRREEAIALMRTAHRVAPDPKRVLDTYARQSETEPDARVRAMLAEAVTRISR